MFFEKTSTIKPTTKKYAPDSFLNSPRYSSPLKLLNGKKNNPKKNKNRMILFNIRC
jgi:hypothetical protein